MAKYAEVLVDVANRRLDQSYHYLLPAHLSAEAGVRVLVPLQHRQVQGLVVSVTDKLPEEVPMKAVRPVISILDEQRVVPAEFIELALWLAETTICSTAQSLHTVWPLLKGKTEEWIIPVVSLDDPDVQTLKWLDPEAFNSLVVLYRAKRKALSWEVFLKRANVTKDFAEKLVNQGWLKKEFRFTSGWEKKGDTASKTAGGDTAVDEGKIAEDGELAVTIGQQNSGDRMPAIRSLTAEQENAVAQLRVALNKREAQTVLLHGVTGSGKTEVYRQAVTEVVNGGGDAILLVPEISLTSQVAGYFQEHFGSQVTVLHSGLTQKEKAAAWGEILAGRKRLVIGARSAVFAPLPNLRLIILDEEHEGAYKQDENPKYHARDVARKRMEQRRGVVLLGSATPSLEAYAAAQTGKIGFLTLTKRVGESLLPPVEIVDMREELARGNRNIFSLSLQGKLRERLARGEQAMLFLNRRGYSTFVVCRECGYTVRCPDCDVALTYHTQGQVMRCHYCNHEELPPHNCPQCGSRYIRFFGQGTQRVEEEIQALFPDAPILRLDQDTTRDSAGYKAILGSFRRQEAQILVGTQMIAKGLDFPNVTLVGVIAADQTLNIPDFRARERTFQLLTQVAGRAGRSTKPGEVLIQTYSPADRAILMASEHDFQGFFREEIAYRKERQYPPFTHMIRVIILHEQEERVIKAAQELANCLRQGMQEPQFGNNGLDILGPAPAVLPRLKNQFRWQVAVKGKNVNLLRKLLHQGVQAFYQSHLSSGINLNIEVDPLSG